MDYTMLVVEMAKDLYSKGYDLDDIAIIGNNLQAISSDEYWISIIENKDEDEES